MTDKEQSPAFAPNSMISTPMAIVIAGALIALALYFSNSGGKTADTTTTTAGTTGTPGNTAAQPAAPTIGNFRPVSNEDHIRGGANAKVTIIEYSDLECPFCKRYHTTMQQIMEKYPNDVRWVYRHFPLSQLHAQARKESLASECAAEQGKFWEFVDLVFQTTSGNDSLDLTTLPDLATQAGVANVGQFTSCVDSEKYADKVDADLADAATAGGRGTPYSVVIGPDDKKVPINGAQPLEQVEAVLKPLLES